MNRTGVLLKKYAGCGIVFGMLTIVLLQLTGADAAALARGTDSSHFTCGGWNLVSSPGPFTLSALSGVAAVSPSDVWAVGGGGNNGTYSRTLIEHWNGTSWQVVSPHIGAYLNSVAALSASNVWAVGGTDAGLTLIEHWDGTRWKVIPSPNGMSPVNILQGVAAVSSSDIWAVGYGGLNVGIPQKTLIEHWNGTQWSIVPSPNGGSSNNDLTGITAISSTDAWAVGYYYNVNANQNAPLTEHWNGTQWSTVKAPGSGNDANFQAVTSTGASHVWAVGFLTNQGGSLIERWNGSRWHIVPSPPNSQFAFWNGLAAYSSRNIWAVGGGASTGTMHWNGTQWSTVPSPNGPGDTNALLGVTMVSAQNAWAVGYSLDSSTGFGSPLIEYYC